VASTIESAEPAKESGCTVPSGSIGEEVELGFAASRVLVDATLARLNHAGRAERNSCCRE